MAHVRDSDTALWLHNKLGSAEELWIPSSISGIIKTSTIDNIFRCFPVLTTTVKLKLLLGILHLPRRNLEEMKHMIEGIIEVALEDTDLWVKLVANIVNTYPMTCTLNLDLLSSPIAQNVLDQLSEKVNETDAFSSLPLECQLVNKSSLQSLVGNLPPLSRHFALKRKPKSAALRADLLHKSSEAVTQMKKGGSGGAVKMAPVKHRDMNRRLSDVSPMRGIQVKATMNRSESLRVTSTPVTPGVNRSFSRISRQQAGGTKLLDISEQPIGGSGIGARDSKRRKKQMMLEQSAQSQAQEDEEEEEPQEKAPDYAAGLVQPVMDVQTQPENEDKHEEDLSRSASLDASHHRTTSDSAEQSSDNEEQMETQEVEETGKSSTFDSSKTTSSESDVNSPHRSTASSSGKEEFKSPQYSSPHLPPPHKPPTSLEKNLQPVYSEQQQSSAQSNLLHSPPVAPNVYQLNNPLYNPPSRPPLAPNQAPQPQISTRLPAQPQLHANARMVLPAGYTLAQHHQPQMLIQQLPRTVLDPTQLGQQPVRQSFYQPQLLHQQAPRQVIRQQIPQQQQQQQVRLVPSNLHRQQMQQQQQQQQQQQAIMTQQPTVFMKSAPFQPQQQLTPPPPKRGLTLTKEQMVEAQEMFRTANRLSRPEKAIILGFMAGSRENPSPEHGDVLQIVLSEARQNIQNPNGGGILPVIVETLFEMDYKTGKSTKKQRFKAAVTNQVSALKT
uniref:negative elongation factor A-like n=1 Tax=Ciona intestinalis TaxID=7719 RepID=UPI000180BBF3|nr:negative elongation factor A-like [Ciona intestinalis]|eukprot:XP_002127529.1 negative elongation factor A-like [Ciona intestinalis]